MSIINSADNIKLGNISVSKIYYNSIVIWSAPNYSSTIYETTNDKPTENK